MPIRGNPCKAPPCCIAVLAMAACGDDATSGGGDAGCGGTAARVASGAPRAKARILVTKPGAQRCARATALGAATVALALTLAGLAQAETYYLRNNGTAAQNAAALTNGGSCASDSSAMSVETHNSASFQPGDTIYICDAIREEVRLTPPSSGSAGNFITYRGDPPGYAGSLEQDLVGTNVAYMMHIRNRTYLRVQNLAFQSNAGADDISNRAGIWIEEDYQETGHIEIENCTFTETVTGILIRGDTRHVGVYQCTFRNMVSSGVGVAKYYGRPDSLKPSYITIGGSRENGNTFINTGREDSPTSGSVPGQAVGTQVDDMVFSYNHVYADEPGWGAGIYLNGVDRILVEHNYLHDLDATHRRPPITFKTDYDWINRDIIVRFNKVGPTHLGNTYVNPDYGIRVGHCMDNVVVYGNYVKDVEACGIEANWGWSLPGTDDGCIMEDVYIFSNVVDTTINQPGVSLSGSGEGNDTITNAYITNNVLYRAVSNYDSDATFRYAINAMSSASKYDGITIKNNIIHTARDNADEHTGIRVEQQDDLLIDYNHHYFPAETPLVYYENSDCEPCAWDSPDRPAGYGEHDTDGDPLFRDEEAEDFSLDESSPCRDSGEALVAAIPPITIQGVQYDLSLSEALHPSTDWSTIPPTVVSADQNDDGSGWEKGAYVYAVAPEYPNGTIDTPASPPSIGVGQAVSFTGTATSGTPPYGHLWDFGGGADSSTAEDPGDVIFAAAGVYAVTYTVSDSAGLADPTPDSVIVTVLDGASGVGGAGAGGSGDEAGCGCRLGGRGRKGAAVLGMSVLLLAGVGRRRSRRRQAGAGGPNCNY